MSDPLKKATPGQPLRMSAAAYNTFVDTARAVRDQQFSGRARRGGMFDYALQQMVVKNVGDDYLICRRLKPNGTQGKIDVYVSKPWTLRRTPFDGETIGGITYTYSSNTVRTAATDTESEEQWITPDYTVDDVIYAALTNVHGELEPEKCGTPQQTDYVDVNVDGRAWAKAE